VRLLKETNMRASSIPLAIGALLTAASLHSAAADAEIISLRAFSPPMERSAFRRSGIEEASNFRRDGERARRTRSGGYGDGFAPYDEGGGPSADGGYGPAAGGSTVNIEIRIAPPSSACAPMQAVASAPGPKIITIGPQPDEAHTGKMPIIIYGTHGGVY
jgi:hypothetical protein